MQRLDLEHSVSPKLVTTRWITIGSLTIPVLIALIITATFFPWVWWGVGVVAALGVAAAWINPLQVRRIRWQEDRDELLIAKGKLWRTLTVVPYGRIQYIEVLEGPVDARYDLAKIKLHTASASSDATIPGLERELARDLRVRLSERAKKMQAL
ncbi:PH domain-containing protein [Corynebacterium sp. 153RC1]|uniref:PH domain-containing protein n=1 Tax=unclassified Corynebacterium TaxID=2624378 RepID=UPI00211B750B|nr:MULTISPECIES: PH domain-containing protein [unclassified Corynebacterium]MCQ9369972.1 PH domain-containing protein [Corynebacterium sp. 35RC1]MCQ9352185.1 PH domain-containing protein [Corynebacterium sp. 209RC1]MCQ9354188.1 PH domain-containing protein [Corynebacterium sp. 1222RC1]MCQ9356468.1 PH domain-containing protein [Corynebacterium sp. 122RC1]MCQ9358570.1 PH domain-containing protein [Corynebacterium sp. 142RC1]